MITQHPRLLWPLPQRIMRYPPNAKRPRLRIMVNPTLRMMLTANQNRHPLPNGESLPPFGHLLHEYHIFHDRLQIG
jgi:hypothetical protein